MKTTFIISTVALAVISLSSSAEVVSTDSLGRGLGVYSNPAMILQGRVSGVRVSAADGAPGGQVNTNIRGLNSVRGVSEPLWIVDGAILTSSAGDTYQAFSDYGNASMTAPVSQLDGLNLYDIESIEVLKNTTATAIYGSRGANGVIIVRTKMPSSEKMSIDVNANAGLNDNAGFSHSHSIALGSHSGRTNYRLSAFYRDTKGVISSSGSNAFGMRVMFDTQSNKVVWFGLNTSFAINRINSTTSTAWYGSPSATLAYRNILPLPYCDPAGISSLEGWSNDYDDLATIIRSTSNFYLTFNFTPSLSWRNSLSFDLQDGNRSIWYGNGTAFGKERNGAAGITYSSLFTLGLKSELSFDRYFAKIHHVRLIGAFEYITDWNKNNVMCGTDFFMHDLRAKGLNLKESPTKIRYFFPTVESLGGHARLAYEFGKYAGFDATARYDINPRFDAGSDFSENLYPAVSAWVDLRNIAFSASEAVSSLRIEGGWGNSGRNRYIPYEMLPFFTGKYPDVEFNLRGYYEGFNRLRTSEWHIGLNAGFLSDRINASITYYDRKSDDRLNVYCFGKESKKNLGVWVTAPLESVQDQISTVGNKGFEADVNILALKKDKVSWTIDINAAYNINRLLRVASADERGFFLNSDGIFANKNIEGESVSSLYGFTVNEDNIVNGEGLLGNTIPKIIGGFNTEFKYAGFRLEMAGNAAFDFNILNMNRMLASAKIETYMGESVAAPFVEKGDYFRLSRATVGYDIPLKSSKIKMLDVHFTATNLLTITKYGGIDPDVNSFGFTNLANGIDYGGYPLYRCFMLGVSAKF